MPHLFSLRTSISVILGLSSLLVSSGVYALGNIPAQDEEAVNRRIQPIATVKVMMTPKSAPGARSGEELYKAFCSACHDSGVAGAPKLGDVAAWAPRIKLGLVGLVQSAVTGKNLMPANGGSDATPEELQRAIILMTNQSGANFPVPK